MNSAALPRDTPTLHAMVVAQQAEIEHLKLIIAKLRRMQFGQRSEKIDEMVGQLELALISLRCSISACWATTRACRVVVSRGSTALFMTRVYANR